MRLAFWVGLFTIFSVSVLWAGDLNGLNQATGVNQTLEEGFGARHSGMGLTFAGFQSDANAAVNAPAAMNDIDDLTFSTSHTEKFGDAKFDDFTIIIPFEGRGSLGLGLSRYGISGIELRPENSSHLQSQAPEVFSIADYQVVGSFSRSWGALDAGFDFNLLYRHLDQDGIGMRGDGMVQYTWSDKWRVGALLKGLLPSSASWESGYMEYEPTDLLLAFGGRFPTPYFYGSLQVATQTEGLFQNQAKSGRQVQGASVFKNPLDLLAQSNLGLEYLFDFGLSLRVGVHELVAAKDFSSTATFGIGYNWGKIVGIDYSFTPHPDLLSTHRISIQFTPAFPKFDGRNFRGKSHSQNQSLEKAPPPSPAAPSSTPIQAAPQIEAAKPGPEIDKTPSSGEKEILEKEDEAP